jgi:hypothetical protein
MDLLRVPVSADPIGVGVHATDAARQLSVYATVVM